MNSVIRHAIIAKLGYIWVVTVMLVACAPHDALGPDVAEVFATSESDAEPKSRYFDLIPKKSIRSEPLVHIAKGIRLLDQDKLAEASREFNRALSLDPTNSYAQFFNGLAYHLQASRGDGSKVALAEQGYRLAIRFDPTNWIARYQLGLLHLDQRKYAEAQRQIAEAVLYNQRDADMLYSLATASYYTRDPRTAAAVLHRLRQMEPESPRVLRATSLVLAALDQPEQASKFLARYTDVTGNAQSTNRLKERLNDWKSFYIRNGELRKFETDDEDLYKLRLAQSSGKQGEGRAEGDAQRQNHLQSSAGSDEPAAKDTDMVIVDVVIIRTEEDLSTRKGVNLLSGLKVQFGGPEDSQPAFQRSVRQDGSVSSTAQRIVVRNFTVPSITYSLNIFNSNADRNEVLARPTLVALNGNESTFFSGTQINAAAVSSGATGGESVQIDKEIGVKLSILPEILDNNRVRLTVNANRTFLQTPSENVQFEFQVNTSKTEVSATVAMEFGETLILSGLSEKETERRRDGVPFLQDLPIIQYLFSQQDTRDFQKSVLILLTPRPPNFVFFDAAKRRRPSRGLRELTEFQARYSDWFRPYPNWASVFHHLQSNSLYREFRTGDVTLERWNDQQTFLQRMKQALEFLFY